MYQASAADILIDLQITMGGARSRQRTDSSMPEIEELDYDNDMA